MNVYVQQSRCSSIPMNYLRIQYYLNILLVYSKYIHVTTYHSCLLQYISLKDIHGFLHSKKPSSFELYASSFVLYAVEGYDPLCMKSLLNEMGRAAILVVDS